MSQLAQAVSTLEQLEAQKFVSTDVASRKVNSDACRQLLSDFTSLRDQLSMQGYLELYDRVTFLAYSFERDVGAATGDGA